MAKQELIYTEHYAGVFEEGLQVCIYCGKVICDYTGHWVSDSGEQIQGWPEGPVYMTGINPVQTMVDKPLENYGGDDPYKRKIVKCV